MVKKKRILVFLVVFTSLIFESNFALCQKNEIELETQNEQIQQETTTETTYPDYAYEFLGKDKFEKLNRKMFNFNMKMNKYALRPIHIVWASIMPKYGMDRIQGVYENALYPRRLVSNLIQRNFAGVKNETIRFLANSTIGLGGMFDPAKRYFNIASTDADMEQALAKYKVKSGPYLVCPILSSSSPRGLAGKALDAALDPSSYVGLPFMSLVKLGLTINNTAYMQPMSYLLEATYADPYDIMRKLYAIENYLKTAPPVEKETTLEVYAPDSAQFSELIAAADENVVYVNNLFFSLPPMLKIEEPVEPAYKTLSGEKIDKIFNLVNNSPHIDEAENDIVDFDKYFALEILTMLADERENLLNTETEYQVSNIQKTEPAGQTNNALQKPKIAIQRHTPTPDRLGSSTTTLAADINLEGYNPQGPVTDAMRTALFDMPEVDKSAWSELSIWNRSFSSRIKTDAVELFPDRAPYKFRFIMQKDKNAPVVIIYPSIGEGIMSHHSVIMGKIFYDKGYSVIIQGSHFQWEFAKSMPSDYRPGIPTRDIDYLKMATTKIINNLQDRYNCEFSDKIVIGTSFGAMTTLFLAEKESKENTLNISKFISINPPIELLYAMRQIDKNTAEWNQNPDNLKERVAIVAAKVLQLLQSENLPKDKIEALPFSEEESKLITGFILHQKLSDLIFTIENGHKSNQAELYEKIRTMNYLEYAKKYLLSDTYATVDAMSTDASLHRISDYLKNNNNYKIYHSLDDYLVNSTQLQKLKQYCGNRIVFFSNGSHLGFLYRKEFIEALKQDIMLKHSTKEFTEGKV